MSFFSPFEAIFLIVGGYFVRMTMTQMRDPKLPFYICDLGEKLRKKKIKTNKATIIIVSTCLGFFVIAL